MDRISLSLTVQGVGAAQAYKREQPANPRPSSERLDAGNDEFKPASAPPAPNRYDELRDRMRLAALRRDAAAVATSDTARANTPTDDGAIADRPPPSG